MVAAPSFDPTLLEELPAWQANATPRPPPLNPREVVRLLDLTSLNADDTERKVRALALRATRPLGEHDPAVVAAVCVYPAFLPLLGTWLDSVGVKTCTVAGGFPHALSPLDVRITEVREAAKLADEVDVALPRHLALDGHWEALFHELAEIRAAAPSTTLKIILSIAELHHPDIVYRTAMVAMMAGADFVKTSTGKDHDRADLDLAAPLFAALKTYMDRAGRRVGLKVAGGIRATEAEAWLSLTADALGEDWIAPETFRIGSSGLLDDLARQSAH